MFHLINEEKFKLVLLSMAIQASADFYLHLYVTVTLSRNIDLATKSLSEIQLSLTVSAPSLLNMLLRLWVTVTHKCDQLRKNTDSMSFGETKEQG